MADLSLMRKCTQPLGPLEAAALVENSVFSFSLSGLFGTFKRESEWI